jgi:hypothetical protein
MKIFATNLAVQAARIQTMIANLKISRPEPQLVANDQ